MNRTLLIGAIGALAVFGALHAGSAAQRPKAEQSQDWTLPWSGTSGLDLQTPGGNIRVMAGEGDEIQVHAIEGASAQDETTARNLLRGITISRHRDGGHWLVEAIWPKPQRAESVWVNFEVRAPRGLDLDAHSGGGNLDVSEVRNARLRTGGGNVSAQDIGGRLEIHTGGGNLRIGQCTGVVEAQTGGGNVEVHQAQASVNAHTGGGNIYVDPCAGPVDAQTGGGNIQVLGCSGSVRVGTGAGNIEVQRAQGPVTANTGAGNIRADVTQARSAAIDLGTGTGGIDLSLPEGISARLDAQTSALGRVEMEPLNGARLNRDRTHLSATLGNGDGSIRLRSGNGTIHIRRSGDR